VRQAHRNVCGKSKQRASVARTCSEGCGRHLAIAHVTLDGKRNQLLLRMRRQKRMAELKKAAMQQQRFGSVRDIGRADFVREVTNAGADVHVVVHLHKDG